ncbi:MAG: MBL fold metallo-hydrolase, partial [Verrucomicrobiota bacterium]
GELELKVLFTPGHSPGHLSFLIEGQGIPQLIAGDTLFAGSIGRTDLPGGDHETLLNSIKSKICVF